MSPKRGDRASVPPPDDEWDVRFGTTEAAVGWEELCRFAVANTRRCLESLRADPRSTADHDRQHRLRGDLASHRQKGHRPLTLLEADGAAVGGGVVTAQVEGQAMLPAVGGGAARRRAGG